MLLRVNDIPLVVRFDAGRIGVPVVFFALIRCDPYDHDPGQETEEHFHDRVPGNKDQGDHDSDKNQAAQSNNFRSETVNVE